MDNYVFCVAIETWKPSSSSGGDLHWIYTTFLTNEPKHLDQLSSK